MITFTKLLQHFPKLYILILVLLTLVMLTITLWPASQPKNPPDATTKTLDLTPKLLIENTQATLQPLPIIHPEKWTSVIVKSGDSLSTLFQRVGLSAQDVYQVSQATKKTKALSPLFPGDTLDFLIKKKVIILFGII